ncbi:MAG TPA: nitrous oxide-stimulated promoter family protein [Tepidisphaeraceae bacterium]|nr:nitrous oxide-stimulated promoter family protein [Tepidisphaeraceae bacterium]
MPRSSKLHRDLKTLALFIRIYCESRHPTAPKSPVQLRTHDVPAIIGRPLDLCPDCAKLLMHAFVKRTRCPMNPKPACKRCPSHCYHPTYRAQIRQVMRYSGRRLLLSGRLDYLFHLLF